jgi:NADPH-dependent glutamate synthase beta subunit-like oxidoreductase
MPKLLIDNQEVEVAVGATILNAARKLGIHIPTMCFLDGIKPSTSCMLCVVEVEGPPAGGQGSPAGGRGSGSLLPACGALAIDGMRIRTNSEQVQQARKVALELLLSDHLGDCMGPCQVACPAEMNIPLMIHQIAAGKFDEAIATVKRDIALPAVLGRICPAPCERVCRRAGVDAAVSICLLKRFVADVDLQSPEPYSPDCKLANGKRVTIIGAGPAGLAAAYYLQQDGYACTVFDDRDKPGGMLRYGVSANKLPPEVLDQEIALIERLGVTFRQQMRIGQALSMDALRADFDAVFVATGVTNSGDAEVLGVATGPGGIVVDTQTYQTRLRGVFAGGDAVRNRKLTVRAVADGKEAAVSIAQYLLGLEVTGPIKPFNIRIGKLEDAELNEFLALASSAGRLSPSASHGGFGNEQASAESERCLHCDCRKADACKLREYAHEYQARAGYYKAQRRSFVQKREHPLVTYEPGKCIDCGLCIEIASKAGERIGLAFVGRGFDVRVAVPFDRSIAEALQKAAADCAGACPTGALARKPACGG